MNRKLLVVLVASGLTACSDIPLLPKWDTEWSFPLVSRTSDQFFGDFTVTIPSGTTFNLPFPVTKVALDQQLQAILGKHLVSASLVYTISKEMAIAGTYTLAVAPDSASLHRALASGIAMDFSIAQDSQTVTDSAQVSGAGLAMLQAVADSRGMLWVQVRGQTKFNGPGTLIITPTDSINVQVTLRATIAASN